MARFSVQFTRVVDMINLLTTAQIHGMLEKKLRLFGRLGVRPAYCRRSFFASANMNRWSSATCEYTASIIFVSL
jgi:hypothetical protein